MVLGFFEESSWNGPANPSNLNHTDERPGLSVAMSPLKFTPKPEILTKASGRRVPWLSIHSVTQAPGGRAGLSYLESNPELVDVVISDLGMPDMTGWDVARTIQSRWPKLPVGLITGWGETEITPEERGRVNFVITKPFDKALLSQTMSDIRPRG